MMARTLMLGAAAALALQAGIVTPVQAETPLDPPAQADCAAVANLDLDDARFHPDWTTGENAVRLARWHGYIGLAQIPEDAPHRPSDTATMIIRAYVPAGGMWPIEDRSVVWREADGSLWFWRWRINYGAPSPMPPPPPLLEPGETWTPPPPPTLEERFPPTTGRLAASRAVGMEAAFNDVCRALDPDYFPYEQPLQRPVEGRDLELCPADSSIFFALIEELGRPAQLYVAACQNDLPTFQLMQGATYAAADEAGS